VVASSKHGYLKAFLKQPKTHSQEKLDSIREKLHAMKENAEATQE
jgi:hypothetical protein